MAKYINAELLTEMLDNALRAQLKLTPQTAEGQNYKNGYINALRYVKSTAFAMAEGSTHGKTANIDRP